MTTVPAFSLPVTGGGELCDQDLVGTPYVLYFYPKDATPGCTTEACDFRDNLARIAAKGVAVYGVSPDSIASHDRFIAKQELTFPLLADEEHHLAEAMGVWKEKKMYGKTFMGIERSTFLVGGDGSVLREWRKVKVKGHVEEVLAAIEELV